MDSLKSFKCESGIEGNRKKNQQMKKYRSGKLIIKKYRWIINNLEEEKKEKIKLNIYLPNIFSVWNYENERTLKM